MAVRTISATGGNFNALTSWLEGIVPVSTDDVIANSTSGSLTVNVASSIQSMQLDNAGTGDFYANSLVLSQNLTITGTTVSFSPNMGMTGPGTLILSATGRHRTYGFTISTNLTISGGGVRTFMDEMNWQTPNGVASRSFQTTAQPQMLLPATYSGVTPSLNLWFSANQAAFPATVASSYIGHGGGSASIILKSHNGTVTGSIESQSNTLYAGGVVIDCAPGTFSLTQATVNINQNIYYLSGGITGSLVYNSYQTGGFSNLSTPFTWNIINYKGQLNSGNTTTTFYNQKWGTINAREFYFAPYSNQSDRTTSITFSGTFNCGISASVFGVVVPTQKQNSTSQVQINKTEIIFVNSQTYSFGSVIFASPGSTITWRSLTASVPATINMYNSSTFSSIANTTIRDINNSGNMLYAFADSSCVRTTGITTSLPSGGSGIAGGSFVFLT